MSADYQEIVGILGQSVVQSPDSTTDSIADCLEIAVWEQAFRIDNRRQSVILLTLHYSLAMYYIESDYVPNESLYFCLSNPINEIIITLIFQKV